MTIEEQVYLICAQLRIGEISVNEATDKILEVTGNKKPKISTVHGAYERIVIPEE